MTPSEMARRFARMRLGATRGEWLDMSIKLARSAYRAGYVRGLEWAERDLHVFEQAATFLQVVGDPLSDYDQAQD